MFFVKQEIYILKSVCFKLLLASKIHLQQTSAIVCPIL
jgi:hypothetical protein